MMLLLLMFTVGFGFVVSVVGFGRELLLQPTNGWIGGRLEVRSFLSLREEIMGVRDRDHILRPIPTSP